MLNLSRRHTNISSDIHVHGNISAISKGFHCDCHDHGLLVHPTYIIRTWCPFFKKVWKIFYSLMDLLSIYLSLFWTTVGISHLFSIFKALFRNYDEILSRTLLLDQFYS